ncbi:hypothetical protein [Spirosoma arcticum]
MQPVKAAIVSSLFLITVFGCEESSITLQEPTARTDRGFTNPPGGGDSFPEGNPSDKAPSPGGLPYPTITKQTFIPDYDLWAQTKCHAWRIEWPNYPAGTDPNKIPTVFTLSNSALNSFDYLNGRPAITTYKTNFNLYHNAQIEMSETLWDELIYSFGAGEEMESIWFNKVTISVKTLEHWVTERPALFESNWVDNNQEPPVYQQGDVFLFRLFGVTPADPDRYGGIRIVSMTPRIIEVYLAVPNN